MTEERRSFHRALQRIHGSDRRSIWVTSLPKCAVVAPLATVRKRLLLFLGIDEASKVISKLKALRRWFVDNFTH
jgi:hypothetical protein